ncbi:Hypothetical predicted protein [Mytilus galloprovincialis]|uniref:C1q domain-containing protein n=1 Tax=Mytilus galloprovincialis TaxID=29158 RepID=A0A8B6E4E6_MYTGA|nr:Hypothetical predicted protein [Mytilus galloprovincialis]
MAKKELKEYITASTVTFQATYLRLVTDGVEHVDETLIFPTIIVNHGDGYDNTTGVFTAPISGMYLFTVQICPAKPTSVFLAFFNMDNPIRRLKLKTTASKKALVNLQMW